MSSTKTQETKLPQWQEDFIREQILPRGIEIAETEYTPYEGELIAGMTPLQEQALSGFGNLNMGGQTYDQAIGVQSRLTGFDPTDMSAAQLAEVERMRGVGAVRAAGAPGQIDVDTLARTSFDPYLSPYTQNVIDLGQQDIERQRQMASNTLGAQAEAAGAFGGSRQAVQEGVLAGEALRQAGALSAQQRQQAFTQALQSGQFDIGNVQQARALASGQQMTAETLGQQAREAAAAREQAARAGNMAAANQFAAQQAQFEQAANAANYQGQFQAAGIQGQAANAMGALAGQRLQSEIAGLGAQMSAGEQQRALEQAQLQADYAMFQEQQAYPLSQLNAVLAAGSGIPAGLGTVTSRDPFGGLTAVGNLLGGFGSAGKGYQAFMGTSDMRLKQNIAPAGSEGGVNFYTWDWNEEGKKVAYEGQPTFGVMAQELEVTHPDLVVIGEDGYRRVKYDELYKRIGR
jgi:hypothetical protein